MTVDPSLLLVQTRQRELQAAARRDELVRIARCCRPSALRSAATAVAERWRAQRRPCCA